MFPRVPLSVLLFCLPFRIYVPRGNEITSFKHQVSVLGTELVSLEIGPFNRYLNHKFDAERRKCKQTNR